MRRYRLRKYEILRRRNEIRRVLEGEKRRGRYMDIRCIEGEGRKVAFFVSRRVGKAVVRNRIRRRLRECYRLNKHSFPDNRWCIVYGKVDAYDAQFKDICDEMKRLMMEEV